MKKIIFLMLCFFAFFLISCNNSHEKSESFANIVKEDSSRIKELLLVADSINQYNENKRVVATPDPDAIDEVEGASFRKPEPLVIDPKNLPVVKFPAWRINRFIRKNGLGDFDTLLFCIGTYKNQHSVDRYNKRNPGSNYLLKDLQGRPSLILKFTSATFSQQFLDAGTLCPPPPDCVN